MFADDSNLFVSSKDLKSLESKVNDALSDIREWLCANRLSLNVDKTNFMIFSPRKTCNNVELCIKIGDKQIEEVKKCKFLGVIVDNQLNWKDQIKALTTKLSKSIGILAKTRKYLDKKTLIQLYYSFMYPYLLYGNIIWGMACKTNLRSIERIQKIAIRLIFNKKRRESTSPIFKKEEIIKVKDLYEYAITIFMHKLVKGKLPPFFMSLFTLNETIHEHATRQLNHFHTPIYRTRLGNNYAIKIGVQIWNKMVKRKLDHLSIGQTKKLVKAEILDRY